MKGRIQFTIKEFIETIVLSGAVIFALLAFLYLFNFFIHLLYRWKGLL